MTVTYVGSVKIVWHHTVVYKCFYLQLLVSKSAIMNKK